MKVLVAYDGTVQAKDALKYGIQKVRTDGGELVALHVFNSTPYLDYDVFGAEDAGRAESTRYAEGARSVLKESGADITSTVVVVEGNPEEETMRYARENNVDLLLCSPSCKSITRSFRMLTGDHGTEVFDETSAEKPRLYVAAHR